MTTRRTAGVARGRTIPPGPVGELIAAGATEAQLARRPEAGGPTVLDLVTSGAWTVAEARLAIDLAVLAVFGVTDAWLDQRAPDAPERTFRALLASGAWTWPRVLTVVGEMKRSAGRCGCGRPAEDGEETCGDCASRIPEASPHREAVRRTASETCDDCLAGHLPRRDPRGEWWHGVQGLRESRIGRCVAEAAWVSGFPGRGRVR